MSFFKRRSSIALIQRIQGEECVLVGLQGISGAWELPTTSKQYDESFLNAGLRALRYQAGIVDVQFVRKLVSSHIHDTFFTRHYTFFIRVERDDYSVDKNLSSAGRLFKWTPVKEAVSDNLSKSTHRALMYWLEVIKRKDC